MPTHIIIDGYNLLSLINRGSVSDGQDGDLAREQLLVTLAKYRQRVGHAITVVFDAWRKPGGRQYQEHRTGVTVIFTKQGEQADQVIQRMVRSQSQDCVVVSSDHEIMNTARAHGAVVLRSQEFLVKLRSPSASVNSRNPRDVKDDDESNVPRRPDKKGNPRKLPKAVRQRLRNLKKF